MACSRAASATRVVLSFSVRFSVTRRHSLRTVPCLNHDELLADVLLRESSVGSAAKLIAALSCNLAGVDGRWVFVP